MPLFRDWWDDLDRPGGSDHFWSPDDEPHGSRSVDYLSHPLMRRNRRRYHAFHPFHHALASRRDRGSSFSTIERDKEKFLVTLDVQQFAPDEINVKVVNGNVVVVEASHEEKEDDHGWVSRQFVRKYVVPAVYDVDRVETFLSSDGILTITAPKKRATDEVEDERIIRIQCTGMPALVGSDGGSSARHDADQGHGSGSTVKAG